MDKFTEKELENLKNYKYSSLGNDDFDNKFEPFWDKVASKVPYNLTPNMVSLIGSLFLQLSILLILYFDYTLSLEIPRYVHIFSALMIFFYQTLDAVDGKHARNSKRASPVGTIVDHSLDALLNYSYPIVIAQAHLLGNSIIVILFQISLQLGLYEYSLEEYVSGKLRSGGGTFFQCILMVLLILPAIIGQKLFALKLFGLNFVSFLIIFYIYGAISIGIEIVKIHSKDKKDAWNKFKYLITLGIFFIGEIISLFLKISKEKRILIIIFNGLYFCLFDAKIIINSVCKRNLKLMDYDILIYLIGISIAAISQNQLMENIILIFLLIWVVFRTYLKVIRCIVIFMEYLKIKF